jgi:ADP-ribose pyrophosphatase YjhB (NUDIX family)
MIDNMSTHKVAVVYAPFQVPSIPDGMLARSVLDFYDTLIIVLPEKRFPNSKCSPLDFETRRQLIHETHPWAKVIKFPEEKDSVVFVEKLEAAVRSQTHLINFRAETPITDIAYTLHTASATAARYTKSGGTWPIEDFPVEWEAELRATVKSPIDNAEFRAGVIYALNKRFPISWMTVDMAILRKRFIADEHKGGTSKTFILLGKKPGEKSWRFPGGFKDRMDLEIEAAVMREGCEEVIGEKDDNPYDYFEYPVYLGSRNIADWRYAGDEDGVTTVFYEMRFVGDPTSIKASDDLAQVGWFDISEVTEDMFVGEHRHLWKLFMERHR